jgi:uncharacterized Zn-finger protein
MNLQFKTIANPHVEVLHVDSKKVSCDGGKGVLGHPLVYLNMGNNDSITCPYCSKFFTIEPRNGNNSAIIGLKNQIEE